MAQTRCVLDKQGYMRAHTHKYVILIAFPRQQRFANAPQYYVIRRLHVLFIFVIDLIKVLNIDMQICELAYYTNFAAYMLTVLCTVLYRLMMLWRGRNM